MPRKMTPKLCDCGCGEMTKGGDYKTGHDRILGAAIERAAGGLLELKALVEETLDCTIDPNSDRDTTPVYRLGDTPYNPNERDNIDSWAKVLLAYSVVGFKPLSFDILVTKTEGHPRPSGAEGFIKWHIKHNRLVKA